MIGNGSIFVDPFFMRIKKGRRRRKLGEENVEMESLPVINERKK